MFDCLNTINIADMTREEAINEIKTWAIPSKKGREVLETLIPELRESDDERIINQLIALVNNTGQVILVPDNKNDGT